MSSSIAQNIEALCQEQGIERDLVIEAMKEAVRAAAKKQFRSGEDIQVDWNPETGIELSASKVVVDEVTTLPSGNRVTPARSPAFLLLLPLRRDETAGATLRVDRLSNATAAAELRQPCPAKQATRVWLHVNRAWGNRNS